MLPTALLDLTLLRLSALRATNAANTVLRRVSARGMQQAALATPSPPYNCPPSMLTPSQTMWDVSAELERRVNALQNAAAVEKADVDPPSYTEQDLIFLYEDLLALPKSDKDSQPDPVALERAQAERDLSVVNTVDKRLYSDTPDTSPEELHDSTDPALHPTVLGPSVQPYHRVLSRAHDIVSRVEAVRASLVDSTAGQDLVPISVLSMPEYESLVRVCVRVRDGDAAERALNIIKRSGVPFPENAITDVLELYADSGNVKGVEHVLATYLTTFPTDRQRHLHVKSHIKATSPDTVPTSALHVLHSYETQCHPAPMQTYTSLITSLFSTHSSLGKAQAWDLFSHMRYVAHPEPDAPLYTLMIRACASPISSSHSSDALRALDLWTEMTVDHRLPPSLGAYNAIILACARSGSKTYVNEAFRLAKQMLDTHRDAQGTSAFRPDRKTFCALLEGAKRLGDLARARWILAEMVNGCNRNKSDVNGDVDEEVMMHVFHAYAAYRPPFRRAATLVNQQADASPSRQKHKISPTSDSEMSTTKDEGQTAHVSPLEATPTFSHIPPQDRSEVIREVKSLFSRILDDISLDPGGGRDMNDTLVNAKKFKNVHLTPRLLNSYLSIYYKHSSLETSRELFWGLFDEHGIPRTSRTYVEALQRCANTKRGHEREFALSFAEEIWAKWQALEDVGQEDGRVLSGRVIEKAHIAFIRVLTLSDQLDRAVRQARLFAERYPPSTLRTTNHTSKPALRSTRTVLVGQRPLIRMTSSTEVPDDHVPPLLMFDDLELLHHRLVAAEAGKEIRYIKYLSKAYEWGLRVRRDNAMKAPLEESSVVARL